MVVEQVIVQTATSEVYAALIDNKLCVKVGYGNWSPGSAGVQVRRQWALAEKPSDNCSLRCVSCCAVLYLDEG